MTAGSPTLRAAPLAGAGAWNPTATPVLFYLSVGLIAGAIIALQIAVMRIFSIASWAHFGSLVISIAMLGFGIASAVMCVGKARIERNQDLLAKICQCVQAPFDEHAWLQRDKIVGDGDEADFEIPPCARRAISA